MLFFNPMLKNGFFLLAGIMTGFFARSQGFFENTRLDASFHRGSFFTSTSKADFVKDSYTSFVNLALSKPIKNYPRPKHILPIHWGAALFFGESGSKQYIGKMGGAFAFLDFGLAGSKRVEIRMRTGLGFGIVEKPYDAETNHKNLLIGSRGNLFIHANLYGRFWLTNQLHINAGGSLSHLSNATSKLPNLGLNVPSISLGAGFLFNSIPLNNYEFDSIINPEFLLQLTSGVKESPWVASNIYQQWLLAAEYRFRQSAYGGFVAGLHFLYDPSQQNLFIDDVITIGIKNYNNFNLAAYGGYEFRLGKISIPVHVGIYVLDHKEKIYQGYGVRYRFHKNISAAGFLKSHGGIADFIHAGLAYHF